MMSFTVFYTVIFQQKGSACGGMVACDKNVGIRNSRCGGGGGANIQLNNNRKRRYKNNKKHYQNEYRNNTTTIATATSTTIYANSRCGGGGVLTYSSTTIANVDIKTIKTLQERVPQ